jgi:uncharacterized protein (DUF697 family)
MKPAVGPDPRLAVLREAIGKLGMERLLDGSWFRKAALEHMRRHSLSVTGAYWDKVFPRLDVEKRADATIGRACRRASVAGVLASAGASTGEIVSIFTEGLAAPIGVPAVALSMCSEAAYTTLLQIDLACDLGSIYGVPFNVDDIGDVTTLFGLALGMPEKKAQATEAAARPVGLTERLLVLEDGEGARMIGRKLLEDALVRNVVPVVGMAISARWNYVATRRLAQAVRRYVRYRRALLVALRQLRLEALPEPEILVEGAWLLATVEGDATNDTALALGLIMDALPEKVRESITADRAFGDDEEGWFDALSVVPPSMHPPLMDVLYLVAAADRAFQPAERRFLHRVGRTLKLDVDLERVEKICRHLSLGEELPADLIHSGR